MHQKWYTLLGTGIAGITIGLDLTIVNASLPSIQTELQANLNQLQWVIVGFGLFFCSFLIVMGRVGDIYGYKRFLIASLVGFSCASFLAGISNTIEILIVMRMTQGFFGAAILPCGTALTAHAFPKSEQGRALGIYGSLVGIGIGLGPIVGGLIETILNWRWIFFINIPIIILGFIFCKSRVSEVKPNQVRNIDWPSAIFLSLFLGGVTFSITQSVFYGSKFYLILLSITISVLSLSFLIQRSKKSKEAILPYYLFHSPEFVLASIIYIGAIAFHWPVLFFMPIYLNNVAGYSLEISGLILSSMSLMTVISPLLAGYLYDKKSKTISIHLIFIFNIISLLMFIFLNKKGHLVIILPSFIFFGIAWGIGNGIATPIALSNNSSKNAGVISGALTTILNIANIMALTLSTASFEIYKKMTYPIIDSKIYLNSKIDEKVIDNSITPTIHRKFTQVDQDIFLGSVSFTYFLILIGTIIFWIIAKRLIKKTNLN